MNLGNVEARIVKKFGKFKKSKGKKGLEYIVKCPFCGKNNKLYINPMHGLYTCFRCGESGSAENLLGRFSFKTAALVKEPLTPLPTDIPPPGELVDLISLDSNHPAILYLEHRNFDPRELGDTFGVRYCSSGRTFAGIFNTSNTLVFPIWMGGKLVGWQARLLYNPDKMSETECAAMDFPQDDDGDYVKPPKYWTSPGLQKGRVFFNYDWTCQSDVVVITEGVFDAMAVGRCGVATLGKGVSDFQTRMIMARWKAAVILLDPGDADDEMLQLESKLSRLLDVVRIDLQGYKDAGDAPRREIWAQIGETAHAAGIDLFQYRIVI
jgi:hypothetical protein